MTERALPKPPTGLRAPGKRLWASILPDLELTPGEIEILGHACHTADEIDQLERELRKQPFTVEGYNGQPRPNPLIAILREHRLLQRRLVDSLNLPFIEEKAGLTANQRRAQHAANIRWNRKEVS